MNLRPYQLAGVDAIHSAFTAHNRVCYTLPTGGGKTVIFADIARLAATAGTRTAILVHRDALLTQASEKLRETGVAHSIIAPGHNFYGDKVAVASVQTLVRRLARHDFDLIIIDEAHHATAGSYRKILNAYPDAFVLGVTATPQRTDGAGLDSVFQQLVSGPGIADLIQDGYLTAPLTYGPLHKLDLTGLRTRMGDYDQHELADLMANTRITGDAVAHYTKLCPGAPAVVFCVNVQRAEDTARAFADAGYRAASVDGSMPLSTVRERIAGLATGALQVLTSCDLISEGTDVPAIHTIINLRPTKSLGLYIQQVGRGLRPVYAAGYTLETRQSRLAAIAASTKPRALVLDHAANVLRFMTADEPRDWSLEGRPKRKGNAVQNIPVRQCDKCFACHRPAPICPHCGYAYPIAARAVATSEGELAPIDKEALRRARRARIAQARTYDDLKLVARDMGYSPQWAWMVYSSRGARA